MTTTISPAPSTGVASPRPVHEGQAAREDLAAALLTAGTLGTDWHPAFRTVARHAFLRHFELDGRYSPEHHHLDARDPRTRAAAVAAAYLDERLIVDRGRRDLVTCSAPQPSLLAAMLKALTSHTAEVQAEGGDAVVSRVLHVGTGTGYTTALLAERFGSAVVTSMDIDPTRVAQASACLAAEGYAPTMLTGDALSTVPEGLFDVLVVTCTVPGVPAHWVRAVRPGGVIVVPIGRCVLRLVVGEDGSAEGSVIATTTTSAPAWGDGGDAALVTDQEILDDCVRGKVGGRRRAGSPARLTDAPMWTLLSLVFPRVRRALVRGSVEDEIGFLDTVTGSRLFARLSLRESVLREAADPHYFWDDVVELHELWIRAQFPAPTRFGLHITAEGEHRVWLDEPSHHVAVALTG